MIQNTPHEPPLSEEELDLLGTSLLEYEGAERNLIAIRCKTLGRLLADLKSARAELVQEQQENLCLREDVTNWKASSNVFEKARDALRARLEKAAAYIDVLEHATGSVHDPYGHVERLSKAWREQPEAEVE